MRFLYEFLHRTRVQCSRRDAHGAREVPNFSKCRWLGARLQFQQWFVILVEEHGDLRQRAAVVQLRYQLVINTFYVDAKAYAVLLASMENLGGFVAECEPQLDKVHKRLRIEFPKPSFSMTSYTVLMLICTGLLCWL